MVASPARLLMVTHTPPWPPTNGGHQRTNLLLRALRGLGEVELVLLEKKPGVITPENREILERDWGLVACFYPEPRWPALLRPLRPLASPAVREGVHSYAKPEVQYAIDPVVRHWLRERVRSRRYDVVIGRHLKPTVRSGALELAPVVLDIDDLDTDAVQMRIDLQSGGWRRALLQRLLAGLKEFIPRQLDRCVALWVNNERNAEEVGRHRASLVPNIPFQPDDDELPEAAPHREGSTALLVVSALIYAANIRGIDRFLKNVWPSVRATRDDAVLRIVGSGMSDELRARWAQVPGVEPVGFVDDLRDAYEECAFAVSPVYEGSGTKIKVLEPFMFGRTCVVTPHSHMGHESALHHGETLWVGSDDAAMAKGCTELLGAPDRCVEMAERGRAVIVEQFSFRSLEARVHAALKPIIESSDGVGPRA